MYLLKWIFYMCIILQYCIGHLQNIGSLGYSHLPKMDTCIIKYFFKKIRLVKITVGLSEMFLSTGRSSHSSWQLQVFQILFWLKAQRLSSAMDTIISFSRSLGLTRFTFEKMSAKYQLSLLLSQPQGAFLWNNHQTSGCSRSTCCIPPTCHIEY